MFSMVLLFKSFLLSISLVLVSAATNSVTYPGIGTFHSNDFFTPNVRPLDFFLPQSPLAIEPTFLLFTRQNLNHPENLKWNNTNRISRSKYFKANLPTKVIVHGFLDNLIVGKWMFEMKNRFLAHENVNVLIVDWSKGNRFPYGQAAVNTRVIGAMIAIQIQVLNSVQNAAIENFHIIGHSLGSHIAGYAGKFLKGSLGQITGLDPAGPYFEGIVPEGKLWYTDAQFVDVIHTDSNNLGLSEANGHVDIYPNGGLNQPGCQQQRLTDFLTKSLAEGIRTLVSCNHQRAVDLYIESITTESKAHVCSNYHDFSLGKCTDCGENEENCAFVGPRSVEYGNNENLFDYHGKRFFITTNRNRPYLH